MEACVLNATSCPSGRQGIWGLEDLDLEDGDWETPDMCFAGGNGQNNELVKLWWKLVRRLNKLFRKKRKDF